MNFREANLNQADFSEVRLSKALIKGKNWFINLNKWKVKGAKEIQENYKVVEEDGNDNYRLEKIAD